MLKNIYKYIIIIIITIILAIAFTGSHSVQSVDDLAYLVAMGIDIGDKESLKVTFQFTIPTPSGESGSGEPATSIVDSVEANSIDGAINLMNAYVSKEINLSHCKSIIISQELAKKGINKEIYSLMNKVQIRPDNRVIISTCTAKEYIESVSPSLENLVTKLYEVSPRSSEYTGYTIDAELGDFFNQLVCQTCEPIAILGNIAPQEEEEENPSEGSSDSSNSGNSGSSNGSNSSSQSDETLSAKNGIENLGVAVFKDDKLVGQLSTEETIAHLLLKNELKSCNIAIPDPEDANTKIDLYLTTSNVAQINVDINNNPHINVNVITNAKIASIDNISQEMSEERLNKIKQSASNYLKNLISNYLYKTSKDFKSDITGFGKYALSKFETMNEFENYNWLEQYQNASFEVNADVTIKSGFLLTGT